MTNVTRFPGPRRQPAGPSGPRGRFDWRAPKTPVLAGYVASLIAVALVIAGAGLVAGLFAVISAVIAASKREEGPLSVRSHHEYNLRGLIIAGSVWVLTGALRFAPLLGEALVWVGLAGGIWLFARTAFGLVNALRDRPVPRPQSLFF